MKSLHTQLALRKDFAFLLKLPYFDVCQVALVTCKTVCIGKMTRRGHPAFARNIETGNVE